jgi:hypothetical protein
MGQTATSLDGRDSAVLLSEADICLRCNIRRDEPKTDFDSRNTTGIGTCLACARVGSETKDSPRRGPILPTIANPARHLRPPAPAAPDLTYHTPIVRSPRRRPKDPASTFAKG